MWRLGRVKGEVDTKHLLLLLTMKGWKNSEADIAALRRPKPRRWLFLRRQVAR